MLDLIRNGWRRVVLLFTYGKASLDRDDLESTHSTPPVSNRVEVSPTVSVVERIGQEIPATTHSTPSVSTGVEASPDQSVMESIGTTHPTSPVSTGVEISPDQNVMESIGTTHPNSPVLKGVEVSLDRDGVKKSGQEIPVTTHFTPSASTGVAASSDQSIGESTGIAQPADTLSPSPVPTARTALPYDFSRWTISEYAESPFEKCGRLYIEGDDLVIRTDPDTRGFRVRLADVVAVLNGEPQAILLLSSGLQVGVAKLSASGKAMNFLIEPFLYTSPLGRVNDVLEGRARKAAVFVGRDG